MSLRLKDLVKRLGKLGEYTLVAPKSGSYWKVYGPNGAMYVIPAHNGQSTELDSEYIDGCCRAMGFDADDIKDKRAHKALVKKKKSDDE